MNYALPPFDTDLLDDDRITELMAHLLENNPRYNPDEMVSVGVAAERTGFSKRTIYRKINEGKVAGVRRIPDCRVIRLHWGEFVEGLRAGGNGQVEGDGHGQERGGIHAGRASR